MVIEDDVEIGANCAIDRATLGSTILRKGVKFHGDRLQKIRIVANNSTTNASLDFGEPLFQAAEASRYDERELESDVVRSSRITVLIRPVRQSWIA